MLDALRQHPGDGGVIRNCVVFINNLALGDDAVVEELVALGADELVASAMAALPGAESPATRMCRVAAQHFC
jgi:hypothetical protein